MSERVREKMTILREMSEDVREKVSILREKCISTGVRIHFLPNYGPG